MMVRTTVITGGKKICMTAETLVDFVHKLTPYLLKEGTVNGQCPLKNTEIGYQRLLLLFVQHLYLLSLSQVLCLQTTRML